MAINDNDLFEVSQASEFIKDTTALGEGTGVQPFISPSEVARLEGLGKQNPIKLADGSYVFPSDFEEWKALMVDQINVALASVLLPATTAAEDARDSSIVAQGLSEAAKGLAEVARDLAQKWADEAYNIEVVAGLYSARHWAQEARNITSGARVYVGGLDASAGILPIAAPTGTDAGKYWRITVEGTLPVVGLAKVSEELAIRSNLSYEVLPAPVVVETINGSKTGAVVLDSSDVGLENVDNFASTFSLLDNSTDKYALAKATYDLKVLVEAAQARGDQGVAQAATAITLANGASADAGAAQITANTALTDAWTANAKAEAAQSDADTGIANAATAQTAAAAAHALAVTKQTAVQVGTAIDTHNSTATHASMSLSGNDLLITL